MSGGQRLGLGTVQFGLPYGITNSVGRLPDEAITAILRLAQEALVDTLDTAHLYGDSEETIGRNRSGDAAFRIVTKTPKFGQVADSGEAVEILHEAFERSLARLGRTSVEGLLFHDPADLLGHHGPRLWEALEDLKRAGKVERIGLSVYEGAEIDLALERFPIDLVQLPWNPIDARLETGGQLRRLKERGVEVHARSLFLQGLLLQEVERIPARFAPIAAAVAELDRIAADEGFTRLEAILAAALARVEIDRFICGVTSRAELHAILLAAQKAKAIEGALRFPLFRDLDPRLLNPARWPELT